MNKEKVIGFIRLLWAPAALMVLGLVLLINPDSASALISRVLGSVLIVVGIGFGVSAIADSHGRVGKVIAALVLAAMGGWLTRNPLAMAAWFGRLVGILLVINGIQDMLQLRSLGRRFALPGLVTLIGAILVLLPMTTTRLVFALCGIMVLIIGVLMMVDRLRGKRLDSGDGNIIDAL